MKSLEQLADNIWLMRFPLRLLGIDFDRNVTIIRLRSSRLIVHSTAPFEASDIVTIRELGEPAYLIDGTLFHDTFAKRGCESFPNARYFAPPGFRQITGVDTQSLAQPPEEWRDEIDVLEIRGIPRVREHVLLHRASRTLVVCDLVFNFTRARHAWDRIFVRHVMRLRRLVGTSVFMRMMIRDKPAFAGSVEQLIAWDFDRLVVGHGDAVNTGAKNVVREAHARL